MDPTGVDQPERLAAGVGLSRAKRHSTSLLQAIQLRPPVPMQLIAFTDALFMRLGEVQGGQQDLVTAFLNELIDIFASP
jgi:hypothetical protein